LEQSVLIPNPLECTFDSLHSSIFNQLQNRSKISTELLNENPVAGQKLCPIFLKQIKPHLSEE